HKIESSIKKNREVTDSLISTGNLKEKQEDARPLVSLIGVWPELEKQPVVFKCEFANVSDQVIKLGESKLCFDFIGPADRNADLTKRFPNANSNYVLTKFNFLVKANGNHTVEYRFVNENP